MVRNLPGGELPQNVGHAIFGSAQYAGLAVDPAMVGARSTQTSEFFGKEGVALVGTS